MKRREKGEKKRKRAIHARPTHCQQSLNALLIAIALQYVPTTQVHALDNSLEDLIEGLLDIEVVSASKRAERLIEAPTSISVVSQEEMRLAGVTNVTEALRLIPGMIISEQRNGFYDVNIRGFDLAPPDLLSHQTASKNLLVMIDNRVIYDQTWGTTAWHDISLAIEDINRIEVVRGPASALYGPNAFTGVVHIITQRPAITQTTFQTAAITTAYEWPLSEDHLLQTEYRYATTTYRNGGRSDDPFGLDKLPIVLDSNSLAIRSDLRLN